MSFRAMSWAASTKTQTPIQKLILLLLADKANDEGFCFPSMSTIAEDACMSRSCVIENVKKLAAQGFICVTKRTITEEETGLKKNTSNLYKLNTGVVVHGDQGVVVLNDQGSRPERLGVVVHGDNNLSVEPIREPIDVARSAHSKTAADSDVGGNKEPPPTPSSLKEHFTPTQRGYNPKIERTFTEKMTDHECAHFLAEELLTKASAAYGRKLIAKPAASVQPIIKLFKAGVSAKEVHLTIKWLYETNAKQEMHFQVESGASLVKKWDRIQVASRDEIGGKAAMAEDSYIIGTTIYFPQRPRICGQVMSQRATEDQIAAHKQIGRFQSE